MSDALLVGETKDKRLSIGQLRQTVRIANEEARGYLDRAKRVEDENSRLHSEIRLYHYQIRQIEAVLSIGVKS